MTPNLPPHLKPKTRIASIQVCRGIAAMLVVLAHLHDQELKYFHSERLSIFRYGVGGVDLFFLISGIVICAVTEGRFGTLKNAGRFLYQRFARIYPIYWFYSLLVLAVYLYNPAWINASGGHHVHLVSSFLLVPTTVPMLLLQGWTLTYEIYFYIVFFLLLLFCPERWALRALAAWAVIAVAIHVAFNPAQPLLQVMTNPLVCEFMAGCFLFTLYRRSSLHPAVGAVLVCAAAAWFVMLHHWTVALHGGNAEWIEDSSLLRPLLYGTMAALLLFGMMELERTRTLRYAAPLVAIGDWSYSMYLSHTIVLKSLCYLFARYAPTASMVWVTALSFGAVLLVGYLSFILIERPLIALLYKPAPRPVKALPHARGNQEPAIAHTPVEEASVSG